MSYPALKDLHVTMVVCSYVLFVTRGVWMLRESPLVHTRFARVVPHVIDTVLLASAVTLAWWSRQYPLVHSWLTAKILALVLYIVLGSMALKRGQTRGQRLISWIAAQISFMYIVAVAVTRSPVPWLR